MKYPKSEWKWFGNAAHFCLGQWCRFHLATQVGPWLISTVGELVPLSCSQGSEKKEHEWLNTHPLGEEIAYGRLFETMVFKAGEPCNSEYCDCGIPEPSGHELARLPANSRKDAADNHMLLCMKWADKEENDSDD